MTEAGTRLVTRGRGAPPCSFEELASTPGDDLDVALGAALIARDVYPDLDVTALLARFDVLAEPLAHESLRDLPAVVQAERLAHHLFEVEGLRGNESSYHDPRNSLLPDVLERRLGIPITLSLVYVEVARRLGVPARGVGFPGHFLVRIDPPCGSPPIVVDPFFRGRLLDDAALDRLLARAAPGQPLRPEHLAPATPRAVLLRMLTNLKLNYLSRGENARALLVLDRMVALAPRSGGLLRERGLVAAKLGAVETACADLARFLELYPDAPDAAVLREQLARLERCARRVCN
jgi:regulator of sirC expression with transglutaminase-like and TPR domain